MRAISVVSSLILVSAGALAFAFGGGGSGGTDPVDPPPPPANTEFAGVLLRVGLGADTLAAAGVTGEQIPALIGAVRSNYAAPTMQNRDETYIAARQAHDRLRRLVQSGKGTEQDVAALRTAEAALTNATNGRENYLGDIRRAALATVSAGQTALVTRVNANHSWSLPTQYLVKDRTEREWVALRDALATKRISEQDEEEEFPQAVRDAIAAVDAETEIATAKVSLDTHIAAVQTAWNTAATN